MDNQPKVTLVQAARLAGVHRNTVKNWQREGKLTSAEKVFERGIEVWYVSPAEVLQVAQQSRDNRLGNSLPPIEPSKGYTQTTDPLPTPQEQTLAIFRETLVKPLTDLIERQGEQIAGLSKQVGRLEAEIEQLKQGQASRQEAPQQAERPKEASEQGHEPPVKKRKWWQSK